MTPNKLIRLIVLTACAFSAPPCFASNLKADFQDPGNEARPRAFWNWLNGDVTHEGLTRDLEEAKAKGLGGLEIWDSEAMQNENGFVPAGPPFLSPESVASIHHTISEAERLDLVVGMVACSGWNAGGPWEVAFDPDWGAPAQVQFPELISWTDHSNEGIRHYSGAGNYTKQVDIASDWLKPGRRLFVDLGDVREIAELYVNGKSAGVLWNPPFRADVTDLVKPGKNELRMEVMNLWINRLVADGDLPEEERLTQTNIRSARQDWEAQPAGLLGPVQLMAAEVHPID